MVFDSFFFLHIPKAGGRHFDSTVIESLKPDFEKNNIKNLIESKKHKGWDSRVSPKTYVTSLFRDPVKQIVSYFVEVHLFDHVGRKRLVDGDVSLNKEIFKIWIENNSANLSNYQSKNFLFVDTYMHNNTFENGISSIKDIEDRLNRVHHFMRSEDLKIINHEQITNKIRFDFGFPLSNYYVNKTEEGFSNYDSVKIFNSLTEYEKNTIMEKYFNIDCEVYNTDKYFWRP